MSCTTLQVNLGDGCPSMATRCGISPADFTKYNPSINCSDLQQGQHVCCSSGTLPDYAPKPYANGTCYTHKVALNEVCSEYAAAYDITVDDIETYNNNTWGWLGCGDMQAELSICLSSGTPPFPAPVANAVCGPQKPGTEPTSDVDSWASLNPCPLNACCDVWGECGITDEFCTITNSTTGNPGTAAKDTNGCISNCGFEIGSDVWPGEYVSIGYFEAFNTAQRSCLNMYPQSIDLSKYTHVYFAFGNITSDFDVDISGAVDMFEEFQELQSVKRIISFGGWDFSTNPDTYMIFRDGVAEANRATFVKNVADFVTNNRLQGVDFDWEYPGEPDIKGIPAGSKDDGSNYVAFLKDLRAALGDDMQISIAAPASYWYLKQYPLLDISHYVDYIIFMTYDLHGTWDLDNDSVQPGCPAGNCLRSHVNLTETKYSLSMITKAKIPTEQVVVGVSSYGRSFKMTSADCTGPECTWSAGGEAYKCTNTVGYIANAEINQLLANGAATSSYDEESDSDIVIYDDNNWVAYMTAKTKQSRTDLYKSYGFVGTTEWAIDLEEFVDPPFEPIGKGTGGGLDKYPAPKCTTGDSDDWKCIQCNNGTSAIDAATFADKWSKAYTDDALSGAISYYNDLPQGSDPSTFGALWTSEITYYLGLQGGYNCSSIGIDPPDCNTDQKCDDYMVGVPVARVWIMNTMSRIRNFYSNWWNDLGNAATDLKSMAANFKDTFAPDQDESLSAKIADFLTDQILGAVGGGIWKGIDDSLKANDDVSDKLGELWDDLWGSISDDVTDAISSTSTLPSASEIESYISSITTAQQNAIVSVYKQLINGSDASEAKFKSMASQGLWLDIDASDMPSFTKTIKQQLLANLLQWAWNATSVYQPVIIMSNKQDDTSNPFGPVYSLYQGMSDSDAENSRYSIPGSGKTFWLVAANRCQEFISNHITNQCVNPSQLFSALPSITALNSTADQWGNLSYTALIESAYNGYVVNKNANGYDINSNPDGSYLAADGTVGKIPWANGVSTPGVFEVPICDYDTAETAVNAVSWTSSPYAPCANYPCCSCEELGLTC